MDLELEVAHVEDRMISISATSQVGGPVHIVLADASVCSEDFPLVGYFQSAPAMSTIPGLVEAQTAQIQSNGCIKVRFIGLKPKRNYVVIAAVNYLSIVEQSKAHELLYQPLVAKAPWKIKVATMPEVLDIEWSRLTPHMKLVELRAAIRSEYVQLKAHTHRPTIRLPTAADLEKVEALTIARGTKGAGRITSLFVDWWVGTESRSSKVRSEFHYIEGVHASMEKSFSTQFFEQGFCTWDELQWMQQLAEEKTKQIAFAVEHNQSLQIDGHDKVAAVETFARFRSWFKGGFIVEEFEQSEKIR
jgi:hypothetical protein